MTRTGLAWCAGALSLTALGSARRAAHVPAATPAFEWVVRAAPVLDSAGRPVHDPFIGGFNNPRPQLVDIDGDGDVDLFVQDAPDNLLYFENVGGGRLEFRTERYQGTHIGEWFRFADLNGDGLHDLLAETPIGYVRIYANRGTRTAPRLELALDSLRDGDGKPIFADPQNILNVVDIDANGRLDLMIGRITGTIDRLEEAGRDGQGFPMFRLVDERWEGIEIVGATSGAPGTLIDTGGTQGADRGAPAATARHGANTLAFGDVRGIGVLDLLWGDFFEPGLLWIRNQGSRAAPSLRGIPKRFPTGRGVLTSGYNAATIGDVNGDGHPDVVIGVVGGAFNPNRTTIDNLFLMTQEGTGAFTLATRRLVSMIDVGSESAPALADLDGDGDLDLLVGNRIAPNDDQTARVSWIENTGTRTAPAFRERGVLPIRGEFSYAPAIADLDGDGLPELVMGTWTDRLVLYRNTGTRAAPQWMLADTAFVRITRGSNTTPTLGDIDGDGLIDLVVGESSGDINVYRNTGTPSAPAFTLVSDQFQGIRSGRRSAPHLADLDGDGRADLLIGAEPGELHLWRNTGARGEIRFTRDSAFQLKSDGYATPAAGDLDGDGRPDLVVGGGGGGLRWFTGRAPRP